MLITRVVEETFDVTWCKSDFMAYGTLRDCRNKSNIKTNECCFWCKGKFFEEDLVGLVGIKGKNNQIICQGCVPEFSGA